MKSAGILIAFLLIIATATMNSAANSHDVATAPRVTFNLDHSQFLSTESASGTLTIQNTTGSEISYSPVGGSFLIRQPDGSQREERWIRYISHPIGSTSIESGKSLTFHKDLPACDVVFDPCTEHVAIKLDLYSKNQQSFSITTPDFAYVFVPDPNATFRVDGLRDNKPLFITQSSTQGADAIARFLNADPLDGARGLTGDDTSGGAFVGARPITSITDRFGNIPTTGEYFGDRWVYIGPPSLSSTIAADRPEIYALVGLKRERCERYGYDCDAAAVVSAVKRARSLAQSLGVGVRYVSLVTLYQDSTWIGHETVVPVGVAMTITGETSATWHRLSVPSPHQSSPATFGVIRPISSAYPMVISRRTSAPDPIPIVVADDTTTINGLGEVAKPFNADLLRVDIAVDAADSNESSGPKPPDPLAVAAMLRTQPGVADVAGQAGAGQLPAVYDLLLKTYDRAAVHRLVAMLRRAYQPLHVAFRYVTSPAISNCDRAYSASAGAAMQAAVNNAHDTRRQLRRLVLAVAYPLTLSKQCEQGAQFDSQSWDYTDKLEIPTDRTVMVFSRVRLLFRASK
jgi:hypothetical protein